MKKLLGISLVAVLAVSPLMARAEGGDPTAATISSEPYLGKAIDQVADKAATASAAYVKGAYNAAIGAINAEHAATVTALAGKQATLTAGDGIDITNNTVSTDLATNGGLAIDSNNKLEVYTTGSTTIEKDSNGALKVKAGSIGTDQLSSGVNATLTAAATKEGVSASIDKATASGNISASVTIPAGSIGGTLTSDASGLRVSADNTKFTNTVTPTTTTVSVPTAWSGTVSLMENWGDDDAKTLPVSVSKSGTDATTTVLTGVSVASTLTDAEVTAATKNAITYTLTGLTGSGTATQTGATFDVHSTGYYDNASDNSPEYVPSAGN